MVEGKRSDPEFEIGFFEAVRRRHPRDATVIELLGALYTRQGRIRDGLRMDRQLVRLQPANATAHYNLACSLALLRRHRAALAELRRAVDLGYRDLAWLEQDPDLARLQGYADFQRILDELRPES